jgi:hypothetical protein
MPNVTPPNCGIEHLHSELKAFSEMKSESVSELKMLADKDHALQAEQNQLEAKIARIQAERHRIDLERLEKSREFDEAKQLGKIIGLLIRNWNKANQEMDGLKSMYAKSGTHQRRFTINGEMNNFRHNMYIMNRLVNTAVNAFGEDLGGLNELLRHMEIRPVEVQLFIIRYDPSKTVSQSGYPHTRLAKILTRMCLNNSDQKLFDRILDMYNVVPTAIREVKVFAHRDGPENDADDVETVTVLKVKVLPKTEYDGTPELYLEVLSNFSGTELVTFDDLPREPTNPFSDENEFIRFIRNGQ